MDDAEYALALRATMADLTHRFATPTTVGATLQGVTTAAVTLIDGVDTADVLLVGDVPNGFESLAATSSLAVELDGLQRTFQQGPCIDAAEGAVLVQCQDLSTDPRWPDFARRAVAVGIHSMLSFQLYTHDTRSGALNLFGSQPGALGAEAQTVGAMLATHAAVAIIASEKELQFQSALASRDAIGQAKGMIMERFGVDAVRAFELLTKLSQDTNTKLAKVAAEIVARGPGG